jgi:hypothetical protein
MSDMIRRVLIFVLVTLVVLTFLVLWRAPAEHYLIYPPPNVLGSTWYGPVLLLLIPLTLAGLSFGVRRTWPQVTVWIASLLVTAICLLLIVLGRQGARPPPFNPDTVSIFD